MEVNLIQPNGVTHWARIYRLYRSAFPKAERKPFTLIRRMQREGKTDIWCCESGGKFAGLAITINGPQQILLDYLAVDPKHRGGGIGSGILRELQQIYTDRHIFLEIESVWEDVPDRETRLRRKRFYISNGFTPMNVMIRLFGVKMELLSTGCKLNYEQYHSFYRDNYNSWVAEHISSEAHPEAECH